MAPFLPFTFFYHTVPGKCWNFWSLWRSLLLPSHLSQPDLDVLWVSLTVLPPLSFYHNFSEESQCWINVIGPILDHWSSAACENQTNLKIDATIYSWSLKLRSLNRAQWLFISWLPLLHSQWCFQHFFMFLEPLIFPSPPSLSADNLVSNFKEKM